MEGEGNFSKPPKPEKPVLSEEEREKYFPRPKGDPWHKKGDNLQFLDQPEKIMKRLIRTCSNPECKKEFGYNWTEVDTIDEAYDGKTHSFCPECEAEKRQEVKTDLEKKFGPRK